MEQCQVKVKFTDSHEWIRVEDSIGIVGMTTQAQKELGEIVYIELPIVGKSVRRGEEVAVLESTKAAADIYAPISGEILEVNTLLIDSPDVMNRAPESDGWIFKIRVVNPQELEQLLTERPSLN